MSRNITQNHDIVIFYDNFQFKPWKFGRIRVYNLVQKLHERVMVIILKREKHDL